jgi:hypothetical protein
MRRSFSLISILLVAGFPAACSFSTASEAQIRMDGGGVGSVDVRQQSDGSNTFEADANVTCVKTNPQATNVPPDILIVFDRSGSMEEDLTGMACGGAGCGATSKWTIATTTMSSFLPTVENAVNWGLKLFATPGSGRNNDVCGVSMTAEVPPAGANSAPITALLASPTVTPNSSTPTTLAIRNATNYLKTLTDPNPKFILLVTDGIPTCGKAMCAAGVNVGNGSTMQCDDANAIAMVKTVHDEGYPTFVLGVGTSGSPGDGTLSQMATNGGYPRNDTPAYYPIDKAADLTAAFQAITGMVGKCFFAISPALKSGQTVTSVTADGTPLAPGDYTLVNTNGVQLMGQKCDDFTNGTIKKIEVQVSCNG